MDKATTTHFGFAEVDEPEKARRVAGVFGASAGAGAEVGARLESVAAALRCRHEGIGDACKNH